MRRAPNQHLKAHTTRLNALSASTKPDLDVADLTALGISAEEIAAWTVQYRRHCDPDEPAPRYALARHLMWLFVDLTDEPKTRPLEGHSEIAESLTVTDAVRWCTALLPLPETERRHRKRYLARWRGVPHGWAYHAAGMRRDEIPAAPTRDDLAAALTLAALHGHHLPPPAST